MSAIVNATSLILQLPPSSVLTASGVAPNPLTIKSKKIRQPHDVTVSYCRPSYRPF